VFNYLTIIVIIIIITVIGVYIYQSLTVFTECCLLSLIISLIYRTIHWYLLCVIAS